MGHEHLPGKAEHRRQDDEWQSPTNLRADSCKVCGSAPAAFVSIHRQIGMLVRRKVEGIDASLCRDCGTAIFRSMTNRTLLFGWWGPLAFFANWGHLLQNLRARRELVKLDPPMPGRTGQPGATPGPMNPGKPMLRRAGVWFVTGIALLVAVIGITESLDDAARDDAGGIARGGELSVFNLRLGDCFNDPSTTSPDGADISDVEAVPCETLHDNEVYEVAEFSAAPGTPYPGDDALFDDAGLRCLERFEAFVGVPYETSDIDITVIAPTQSSWNADDRTYLCAVYDLNGRVRGSLAGVRR